ncbi:MAG: division/cell wall cluster transcriptional repressor MraZ [Bacteroidetes bacterium]|nr:division/cell wall cluster transcriptional repressor MraZ [Bacteroidota bacterium]
MPHLIGSHECKLDTKGRLLFPAPLRKQLSNAVDEGFVIKPSTSGTYLELYLKSEFQKKLDYLAQNLNMFIPENQQYVRMFEHKCRIVELDPAGRILIPKELIDFANISTDLVIQPSLGRVIEIWNKKAFDVHIEEIRKTFTEMGKTIWGNPFNNQNLK